MKKAVRDKEVKIQDRVAIMKESTRMITETKPITTPE